MPVSNTTLGDLRAEIGWLIPNSSDFLTAVNEARRSIFGRGIWEGLLGPVIFNGSTTGFITLPVGYESIVGVTVDKVPQMVFGQFQQYIESGPGTLDITKPGIGQLIMMGDLFPSSLDMIPGDVLKFVLENPSADAGLAIRVFYDKTDNTAFYDSTGVKGEGLTFSGSSVTTSLPANTFTGLQLPVTKAGVLAYSHNTTTSVDTLISQYAPFETRPHYTRYQTGTYDATVPIGTLCKRRYTPLINDTDFCVPDNVMAMKYAVQAVDAGNVRNYDDAAKAWQLVYEELNDDLKGLRGKAQPVISLIGPGDNRWRIKTN